MSQTANVNTAPEEQRQAEYLTKYGFMRCSYLQHHRPDLYMEYLQNGELKFHCLEVQAIAGKRLKNMMNEQPIQK